MTVDLQSDRINYVRLTDSKSEALVMPQWLLERKVPQFCRAGKFMVSKRTYHAVLVNF
jgi:hypothetical protein